MPKKPPGEIERIIGKRIRQRRLELALSQQSLGDAIDVSFQQIQKYESGNGRITVSTLIEIAWLLQMPVMWFLQDWRGDQDA